MSDSEAESGAPWVREYWFATPHEPYTTGAAVVTCFDARFELTVRKLCRRWDITHPDIIRVAGGPKALLSGTPAERDVLLHQLRLSRQLHAATRVLLIMHADCGAYHDATRVVRGQPERERAFYRAELERAATQLQHALPELQTTLCFVDFEGAWVPNGAQRC